MSLLCASYKPLMCIHHVMSLEAHNVQGEFLIACRVNITCRVNRNVQAYMGISLIRNFNRLGLPEDPRHRPTEES